MTTNDRKPWRFGPVFVLLATLLLLPAPPAHAAELTVAEYVDLTIARLELSRNTWSVEGRSPVETEEAAVFESRGSTSRAYYRFAGEHGREIQSFLEEHMDKRDQIEALSREIESLIEQAEVNP